MNDRRRSHSSAARTPRPYLSICAIYRNEAQYLAEWIEFHRLVGVERFYLYDNRSDDDHEAVLAPYIDEGLAVLRPWPMFPGQKAAYDDCLEHHRHDSRWIAFIDLDEFLFSPTGESVSEALTNYENWPGVGVNWAIFGTSGHDQRPPGLVIENYTRRLYNPPAETHIKSIVDPLRVTTCQGVHSFYYRSGHAVSEGLVPINGPFTETTSYSRLRLNHYYTKSEEDLARKVAQRRADTGELRDVSLHPAGQLAGSYDDDGSVRRYVPAVREALTRRFDQVPAAAERIERSRTRHVDLD